MEEGKEDYLRHHHSRFFIPASATLHSYISHFTHRYIGVNEGEKENIPDSTATLGSNAE